jgi:hypothetical protein
MPEKLQELDTAVERLYDAFSAVQPRDDLRTDLCDHCVSAQEAEMLTATPLRDINAGLLRHFMSHALAFTWGTPDDLQHFLPRILELVAAGEYNSIDTTSLFSSLPWHEWPPAHQAALAWYMTALWRATITTTWQPLTLDALDVLEAAADLGMPVQPYLDQWADDSSEATALHLAQLIRRDRFPRTLDTGWKHAVGQWRAGPAPRQIVAAALASASTPEAAASLSDVLKTLDAQNARALPPGPRDDASAAGDTRTRPCHIRAPRQGKRRSATVTHRLSSPPDQGERFRRSRRKPHDRTSKLVMRVRFPSPAPGFTQVSPSIRTGIPT